jgi:hypothetical protein
MEEWEKWSIRTKRERIIPGELEVLRGEAAGDSRKTSDSCRREEKKPIGRKENKGREGI